jgi:hypothetical protein
MKTSNSLPLYTIKITYEKLYKNKNFIFYFLYIQKI